MKPETLEKEIGEHTEKQQLAMANIRAATGLPIIQANVPGVSLVPVADGDIAHSDTIKPQEMLDAMMAEPLLIEQGLQADAAAAVLQ